MHSTMEGSYVCSKPKQTSQKFPHVQRIAEEYHNIIEIRNLYWIQRVLLEMQLPARYLAGFPLLYDQRIRIRSIIDRCEQAMVYMKCWADQQGWKLDFQAIEMQSHENNIFNLLEPYIQADNSKTNMERGVEFEVEY
jgi:hypothetical protein